MKILLCLIGLRYVGLPVLLKISRHFISCAFDINKNRIITLKKIDTNNKFKSLNRFSYQNNCLKY